MAEWRDKTFIREGLEQRWRKVVRQKRVYSMRAHRVGLPAEMLGSPTCSWDPTSRQCLSAAATLRETPTPGGTLGSAGSHFEPATTS